MIQDRDEQSHFFTLHCHWIICYAHLAIHTKSGTSKFAGRRFFLLCNGMLHCLH